MDLLKLTKDILGAHGVIVSTLPNLDENIHEFDNDLRSRLYPTNTYRSIAQYLRNHCKDRVLYLSQDYFEMNHFILRLPKDLDPTAEYLVVGPFMYKDYEEVLDEVLERNNLPLPLRSELAAYYSSIPHITTSTLEHQVFTLCKLLLGTDDFQYDQNSMRFPQAKEEAFILQDNPNAMQLAVIEARYAIEEAMLSAVARGDLVKAREHMAAFNRYRLEQRSANPFRNSKNYLISLNTMLRKAVQRADVHPAHINRTSTMTVNAIEAAKSPSELSPLVSEMLRKYCLLVRNHSFMAYSKPVIQALNYIDFHYTEDLSLALLSSAAAVSPSYLSTQFKKEVHQSVVEYINSKRLKRAQFLLTTAPKLPISQVAQMAGFSDDTYFARSFKRQTGMTPSAYKQSFRYERTLGTNIAMKEKSS